MITYSRRNVPGPAPAVKGGRQRRPGRQRLHRPDQLRGQDLQGPLAREGPPPGEQEEADRAGLQRTPETVQKEKL